MSESLAPATAFDAVVVAGGGGRRLGGLVKGDLDLGAGRLLDGILDACADARARVVVGDLEVPPGVLTTQEDPPGGGPAAGAVAGLRALPEPGADLVLLLASDLPAAGAGVRRLLGEAGSLRRQGDGVCLAGDDGHPQWLFGLYRRASLEQAAAQVGTGHDRSMKRLLAPLALRTVTAGWETLGDVDTWDDADRWRDHLARGGR